MSTTQDFLFELGCEELPPKSLSNLSDKLEAGVKQALVGAGLNFKSTEKHATPRRLSVIVYQLDTQQPDKTVEIKGPPVKAAYDKEGNLTKAGAGFAKKNSIEPEDLKTIETDKGSWLYVEKLEKGRSAKEILPEAIEKSLAKLPIAKRMRWGKSQASFVRPVQWMVALLDDQILDFSLFDLPTTQQSYGHRIHAPDPLTITSAKEYSQILQQQGKVISTIQERKANILESIAQATAAIEGQAVIDEDLLEEVTALVEWPKAIVGKFDHSFLEVPSEALISSMQEHQKYFPVVDKNKNLLPYFVTIANLDSNDMQQVIEGNEKVIRPRLADAQFFFEQDKKRSLDQLSAPLNNIVFQNQLGTVGEKVSRVAALAALVANQIGAEEAHSARAGTLCKADLTSEMVKEFPELQGTMGYYYAKVHQEADAVAIAIKEHYYPVNAGGDIPSTLEGIAVSIADKLDTLVGIFAIKQQPTGDKDPFAVRRASLGILRMIIEKQLPIDLKELITAAMNQFNDTLRREGLIEETLEFFFGRYRTFYQSQGIDTDVIQSVEKLSPTSPVDFNARIAAVQEFKKLPAAISLAAANKRVGNILRKSDVEIPNTVNEALLKENAEQSLFEQIAQAQQKNDPLISSHAYIDALQILASLKEPIDLFFNEVMVNSEDEQLKINRLALLKKLRSLFLPIADISVIHTE